LGVGVGNFQAALTFSNGYRSWVHVHSLLRAWQYD